MKSQMRKLFEVLSQEPDKKGEGFYALGENRVCIKWDLMDSSSPQRVICNGRAHFWSLAAGWVDLFTAQVRGTDREVVKKDVVDQLLGWCVMFFDGEDS